MLSDLLQEETKKLQSMYCFSKDYIDLYTLGSLQRFSGQLYKFHTEQHNTEVAQSDERLGYRTFYLLHTADTYLSEKFDDIEFSSLSYWT